MQAGLEHLSWAGGTLRDVDVLLLVTEAHTKSLRTAHRAHALAVQLGIASVAVVGNRLLDTDRDRVDRFASERGLPLVAAVPEDPAVRAADRAGTCLLDHSPNAPATTALLPLADRLTRIHQP